MTDIAERLARAGLRVKPLEWVNDEDRVCAYTPIGHYSLVKDGNWFRCFSDHGELRDRPSYGPFENEAAARAAAEADNSARAYGMMEVMDE